MKRLQKNIVRNALLAVTVALGVFSASAADLSRTVNPDIGITPTTCAFDCNGGVQGIITSGSGTWYASSSVSWITVTTVSGTAGYSVSYTVAAYSGVEKRTGTVYVSGREHTVTQTGTAATLSSASVEIGASGGPCSVEVSAMAGQTWHAQSNVDWIQLAATSGTGSQTVTFTVSAYDEVSTRRGTLTIADNTFTVCQTGALMKLSASGAEVDYLGETVKVRVNALADTAWSVSEDADWLTIADAGPGLGGGSVKIVVAENPSANDRSAVVAMGTESFTVRQLGRTALVFKTDKTELAVGASGASSETLAVTATPDLGWTASADADWIVFTRSSGAGTGTVGFKVSANPTLMERRATVTVKASDSRVAVRTLAIVQDAATAELTGSAYTFEAAGESTQVGVSTDAIVAWTVQNPLPWLTVAGATEVGPAALTLTAAANPTVTPRSGTLVIAGCEYTVTQKGQGVSLDVLAKAFDTDGRPLDGSTENAVAVTAPSGVAWTAVPSDATWIVLYAGKSGTGCGTVKFVVAPYVGGGEVREGTITIGDQVVRVSQRPYRLSIEPNGQRVTPNAGAGEIQVALDIEGVWEAISTAPWIRVVSGYASGTGSGKVLFEYTDNDTGKERVGKIVISGTEYTLTQTARQRVLIDAQASGRGGCVSGGGTYGVGDRAALTAVAESGYAFTGWTLPGGGTSTELTLSVTAAASGSYRANFAALAPTILKAESALKGVLLVWTNLAWATTYRVWRGTETDRSSATKVATIAAGDACAYRDATGEVGRQYWYWIEAVGLDDDTWSDGVAATRQRSTFAIAYQNLRGTTHANPASYTEGDAVTFAAPSARRGFTFVGWSPSGVTDETSGDLTVRAVWRQNEYTVSYDLNGGTGSAPDERFTYGFWRYLAGTNAVRERYAFQGWSRARNGDVAFAGGASVKNLSAADGGEVALYAQWRVRADAYAVRFDADGGEGAMEDQAFLLGEERALTVNAFTRTGYAFAGWRRDGDAVLYADGATVSNLTAEGGAVVTLKAQWAAVDYAITYADTKGCANANPATYTIEDEVTFAALAAPAGWRFLGWSPAKIAKGTTGAKTVTAQWEQLKYAVDIDGVAEGAAQGGCVYGQEVTAATFAERTAGYTNIVCLGWVGSGDVPATGTGTQVTFTVTQASSLRWTYQTNYWVSVGACDGEGAVATSGDGEGAVATSGGSVTLRDGGGAVVTNLGWYAKGTDLVAEATANGGQLFVGWRGGISALPLRDAGEDSVISCETPLSLRVDAPIFLRAEFVGGAYAVRFESAGGVERQVFAYGKVYGLPACAATPSKGKRFVGWRGSNGRRYDGGVLVFNLAEPGGTVTMTAIWE